MRIARFGLRDASKKGIVGRGQKTDDRSQITDNRTQMTEGFDFGIRNSEWGMRNEIMRSGVVGSIDIRHSSFVQLRVASCDGHLIGLLSCIGCWKDGGYEIEGRGFKA